MVSSITPYTKNLVMLFESQCSLKIYHANCVFLPQERMHCTSQRIAQCRVNSIPVTEHLKITSFFRRLFCEQLVQHNLAFALNKSHCHLYSLPRAPSDLSEQPWKHCIDGLVVHYIFVTFHYRE